MKSEKKKRRMQRELNPNYARLSVQQQRVIDKMEKEFWRVQKNFKSSKTRTLIYNNIQTMVDEPNSKNGIRLWRDMRIMRADALPMDPTQSQEPSLITDEDDPFSLFYRPENQIQPRTRSEQAEYERLRIASFQPTEVRGTSTTRSPSLPRTPRTSLPEVLGEEREEGAEEGREEESTPPPSPQLTFSPQTWFDSPSPVRTAQSPRAPQRIPTPQRMPQRRTPARPTEREEELKHNQEQEAKEEKEEKEEKGEEKEVRYPAFVDKPDIAQGGAEKYTIFCGRNPQNKPPNSIWGDQYACMMKGFAMGKNAARLGR